VTAGRTETPRLTAAGRLVDDRRILRLRVDAAGALGLRLSAKGERPQQQRRRGQRQYEFAHLDLPFVVVSASEKTNTTVEQQADLTRHP
jgi:hypothetical protein